MAASKTETLPVRIEPAVKEELKTMAGQERRSIANMIEVMIRDYCRRNGIAIPEGGALESKPHAAKLRRNKPMRTKDN